MGKYQSHIKQMILVPQHNLQVTTRRCGILECNNRYEQTIFQIVKPLFNIVAMFWNISKLSHNLVLMATLLLKQELSVKIKFYIRVLNTMFSYRNLIIVLYCLLFCRSQFPHHRRSQITRKATSTERQAVITIFGLKSISISHFTKKTLVFIYLYSFICSSIMSRHHCPLKNIAHVNYFS